MARALPSDTMSSAMQMNHTAQLTNSLNLAARLAPSLGHSQVVPAHLLLVLLEDSEISFLLNAYGVDIRQAKTSVVRLFPKVTPKKTPNEEVMPFSEGLEIVLSHAGESAHKNGLTEINSTFMFATLLREDNAFSKVLDDYDLSYDSVSQFIEMQTGSAINIDPVPAYTLQNDIYLPPPPKPASPMAAPKAASAVAAPPASKPVMEQPAPAPRQEAPPTEKPKKRAVKNKVISFSHILKRNSDTDMAEQGDPAPAQNPRPTPQQQQQPTMFQAEASSSQGNPTPISRPVLQQPATPPQQPAVTPQTPNSTVSATGSVIEKGILVVPQELSMEIGKPQIVHVRIARNPQAAASTNDSYDKIVMEALTTQLHAPGQNFHIKSLLPETHWIDHSLQQDNTHMGGDFGQWQWEVTPLQRGANKLSLVVSSRTLNQDNQLSSITLPQKTIEVRVGMNIMSLVLKFILLSAIIGLSVATALFLPKFM